MLYEKNDMPAYFMTLEWEVDSPLWTQEVMAILSQRIEQLNFTPYFLDDSPIAKTDMADNGQVIALLCDDKRIQELNQQWRGKNKPTNILSFPNSDIFPIMAGEPKEWGNIALAFETVHQEAQQRKLSLHDHATHLIIHGILHLLGYDHEEENDAIRMEQVEVELMHHLGLHDPYS